MDPTLSSVVTKDDKLWSRDKSKKLYLHIRKTHDSQNLVKPWLKDEGGPPIFPQPQDLWPPNLEGYWLFYPSQHFNVGSTLFQRCGSTLK